MRTISDIGSILEVTPQEEIWIQSDPDTCEYIRDFSAFRMRVDGLLEENGVLFGVFGPVLSGPGRYQGLLANVTVRLDGSDWRRDVSTQANFKVGPGKVYRIPEFDWRNPVGTEIDGFPVIGRFGRVKVIDMEPSEP